MLKNAITYLLLSAVFTVYISAVRAVCAVFVTGPAEFVDDRLGSDSSHGGR